MGKKRDDYRFKMLVYPNITKRMDEIWKDSYIVLLPHVIRALSKINRDLHITLWNPIYMKEFDSMSNVEQKVYNTEISSNNNRMRTSFHFDGGLFMDLLDWRNNDYDIVYSHLPEHTLQISNLIYNQTHSVPRFFGYCHWFELANATQKKMLLQNYIGIMEMEQCGVNSQWLKEKVMDDARTYFNDETMDKLDNIIQPHTLGIESTDFSEVKYGERKNIIFNHRGQHYMGWGWFCKAMDELWKRRQDFKVLTFQRDANGVKYPWTDYQSPLNLNRDDYFKRMKEDGYIGVGCFTSSKGGGGASWSISITDLLSLGVPCVLPNKFVYPSLVGDNYPLLYKSQNQDEFLTQIENVLDNPKLRQKSVNHLKPIMTKMKWTSQVKSWMDWDKFFDPHSFKMVGENAGGYDKMVNIIKQNKKITTGQLKSQLGWGVSFKTGSYRNRLRIDNRIKFTTNGYEWVG